MTNVDTMDGSRRQIVAPNKLWLSVTNRCNLRCKHCLPDSRRAMENELTAGEIHALIADADRLGVKRFAFTGGEPLLRQEVPEFIADASGRGMRVYLETNATLTTQATLERLRAMGLAILNLSLDSADAGQHDALRGGANFEKVVAAARAGVKLGLDVRVYCTVTRPAIEAALELPSLFGDLEGRLGVLTYSFFSPLGRGALNPELAVGAAEWTRFCARVEEARARHERRLGPIRYEPSTVPAARYGAIRSELGYDIGCIARGRDYVYVNPVGSVFGCAVSIGALPPLGNVRSRPLADIWFDDDAWSIYCDSSCDGCPAFAAAAQLVKRDFRERQLPPGHRLICPMTQYPKIEPWIYERSTP
jgi:MoaA/NifB/PqqE/SkfB family radical SAM enzyme